MPNVAPPQPNAASDVPQDAQNPSRDTAGKTTTLAARAMILDPSAAERRDLDRFGRLVDQVCSDLRGLGAVDAPAAETDVSIPPRHVDVKV